MEELISNNDFCNDADTRNTVTLKEAADILGLKYHTARNLMLNNSKIGYIDYGCKRLWLRDEVVKYKLEHYNHPSE